MRPTRSVALSVDNVELVNSGNIETLVLDDPKPGNGARSPLGQAGDLVLVREPLIRGPRGRARYASDEAYVEVDGQHVDWSWKAHSVTAPKTMARLVLEVVHIEFDKASDTWAAQVRKR